MERIYKNGAEMDEQNHACIGFGGYLKEENLSLHVYQYNIFITDLSNALLHGKECEQYCFEPLNTFNGVQPGFEVWRNIKHHEWLEGSYTKILQLAQGLNWKDKDGYFEPISLPEYNFKVSKSLLKSNRVFSPFALSRITPLKEIPKKWTLTHVYKALVNHQYKDLKCEGVYTDDYAFDAAYDFQKGVIGNGLSFISKIIESPSGWYAYQDKEDGRVSINCHSFDCNSFIPVLEPSFKYVGVCLNCHKTVTALNNDGECPDCVKNYQPIA